MLVQAGADEHGQYVHLPLVLHEGAGNAYILLHIAVIARHDIVQGVVLILQSAREGGGGEKAVVHVAHVHAACHPRQVVRLAVGVHVLLCAVVAVAVGVLDRAVQGDFMLILAPEEVVTQSAAVNDVLGLLGDVRLVGLKVELVAAAAELVGGVIFQVDAAEMRGTVVGAEAEGVHVQLAQFGETVAVTVVRIAVAVAFVEGDAVGVVFGHQGYVPTHVLLPGLAVHVGEHARHLEGVVNGVFGDDIDSSAHSIGAEQRRTAAAYHLYPLDHVHRYLLQPIYPAQRTDDGTAVYQDLRVRAFQTVDTHLGETAVLAVVLHPQARLVVECLGKVGGVHHLKELGAHHVHHHGSSLATHLVAVGGHHDLIGHEAFLFHLEMHHRRKVLVYFNRLFLCLIAYGGYAQRIFARRQVLELELTFFIGHCSLSAAYNQNGGIRYILFRTFYKNMAGNHVAFPDRVCGNGCADTCHSKHQRQYNLFHLNNRFYFSYLMIPILYRYLVRQVPKAGTTDTKHWYGEYQRLVHRIPSIGTTNTQRWYGAYQALVQHYQRVTE